MLKKLEYLNEIVKLLLLPKDNKEKGTLFRNIQNTGR